MSLTKELKNYYLDQFHAQIQNVCVLCSRMSQTVDPEIKYPHLLQLNSHVKLDADIAQAISLY